MILELAEAPTKFEPLAPGEELVVSENAVVFFGRGTDARSCAIQRVRFGASPEATVEEVRKLLKAKGRARSTWEILVPPHRQSTIELLLSLGMQPSVPPYAVIMTLSSDPLRSNPDVSITSVETTDEFKVHVTVTHEVFGMLDRLPTELARIDAEGASKLADRTFVRYVARIDGKPVGAATATFTSAGVMLHSGSTLAEFRGRGVYSSLVAHRWREAVARETPHLITRAGRMSRPILQKLGFAELGEVHFLVDSRA